MAGLFSKIVKWIPLGNVEEISIEEVNELVKENSDGIQLLDVRTSMEWKAGHIPGAINVPITELASKVESLDLRQDVLLVPICLSAHRSIPAVRLFKGLGFSDVRQLSGGMKAWNKSFKSLLVKGE